MQKAVKQTSDKYICMVKVTGSAGDLFYIYISMN